MIQTDLHINVESESAEFHNEVLYEIRQLLQKLQKQYSIKKTKLTACRVSFREFTKEVQ